MSTISGYLSPKQDAFLDKYGGIIFDKVKVTKGKVPNGSEVLHISCFNVEEGKWYRGKGSMNCAITLREKD